ncbi:hypothetical protein [Raoultibacter timonensis]|nr:hypothetical protein [Raoultibacter timonensis]
MRQSKGAIRFPYSESVDYDLIADITAWRIATIEGSVRAGD